MSKLVCVGQIVNVHGIKGGVKIKPFLTNPMDIALFDGLTDKNGKKVFKLKVQSQNKGLVLCYIEGIKDRTMAEALKGLELYVEREELGGKTIAEALLVPTKIYVKPILALLEKVDVKGISHITGGGFYENIPRSIPDGLCAKIDKSAIKVLPIFDLIAKTGNIPERDMYNTYNMGVGMSVVVPAKDVPEALSILSENGVDAYVIGSIIANDEKVVLE